MIENPVLADLEFRALDDGDAEAGAALARSRGWAYEPARWRFGLEVGRGWGAVDPAGRLVGTVQLTECTAGVAAVGSMLVAEPLERQGLGRALLERALDAAGDRVVTLAATRPGRPLYERLGFRPLGELLMCPGRAGGAGREEGGAGREDSPSPRRAGPVDLPALAALDATAHGGDRTRLLTALLRFATSVRVLDDAAAGGAAAYGAVWPSEGRHIVGPLVAVDAEAAVAVLDALLGDVSGSVRVDVHAGRSAVVAALAARGAVPVASTTVMVRRPHERLPGLGDLVHAPIMQSLT